jgi:hypothetical protein
MAFYELPGLIINKDALVGIVTLNDKNYILHTVSGGEYHLSEEQTEAFKKLGEKDSKSETLSLRKKGSASDDGTDANTVFAPAPNETFAPPLAPDHPLNPLNVASNPATINPNAGERGSVAAGSAPAIANQFDPPGQTPVVVSALDPAPAVNEK